MKVLAVILARGGSKRCPGKNIRLLGQKPLISWTIDVAKEIPAISNILVSTDSQLIAEIAKQSEVLVPWLRPEHLSSDNATSVDGLLHALDWYEEIYGCVDAVILLQPTSPFRSYETIKKGIDLFLGGEGTSIVGVSPVHSSPFWSFTIINGYLEPLLKEHGLKKRSQDIPLSYVVNGSFYMISPDQLRLEQTLFPDLSIPLVIESKKEALDIDDEWDFMMAECIVKNIP